MGARYIHGVGEAAWMATTAWSSCRHTGLLKNHFAHITQNRGQSSAVAIKTETKKEHFAIDLRWFNQDTYRMNGYLSLFLLVYVLELRRATEQLILGACVVNFGDATCGYG